MMKLKNQFNYLQLNTISQPTWNHSGSNFNDDFLDYHSKFHTF